MANIRTARRSGLVLRGGRQRRETLWLGGVETSSTVAGAGTAVLLASLNAAALALRPFTIVRTHAMTLLRSDQAAAAETQIGFYGLAVVSDQASAIGVTAVPTPFTDNGSDLWFLFDMAIQRFGFGSGVGFEEPSGTQRWIDSKAMRKVEDGQDIVSVFETSTNSAGVIFQSFFRQLIKIH